MKKLIFLSTLLAVSLLAKPQTAFTLTEGEPAIIYSLPKTEFCIEIETEKITQKPGPFYIYSERYLATKNVITEEKINYRLKSVVVKTRAVPDATRTYSFVPANSSQTSHLSVNSQGILCGVNVACETEKVSNKVTELPLKANSTSDDLLPLGEEYMMAGSDAKLAEGVAKQIYHIRESRVSLLTADVDKLPADGGSFKTMLDGLNKMERELTALFVGKITTETQTQQIYLTPTSAVNGQILFRLSSFKGIVSSDDLSGAPYYINIIPTTIPMTNDKLKYEKSAILYILPASTQVSISDGLNTIYTNQFFIPQFGKTIPLPESLFKQLNVKIKIDSQTGRLLRIE